MARFQPAARAQSTRAPVSDSRRQLVEAEPERPLQAVHKPVSGRRRPLSRTVSPARWREYRRLLEALEQQGYECFSLEDWLLARGSSAPRAAILRHDVDQHPRSVLALLKLEQRAGVHSTWYFRWRTADPSVISAVRHAGGHVGLHYETLTRMVRARGLSLDQVDEDLIAEARELLAREIAAFKQIFGPIRSVCPHGDSRVPGVTNQVLLKGQRYEDYGVSFDGNDAINHYPLSLWLTDRSIPDGRWKERIDPHSVLAEGTSPVLLVVHPNNWCSGPSLWLDRLLGLALPRRRPGATRSRIPRTGTDTPPPLPARPRSAHINGSSRTAEFGHVAMSLQREILRFTYDSGKSLTDPAGLNTLATNAALAESRAAMLEYALGEAGVASVRGLDVADIGCGFGALALVFAAHGARVVAVDPKDDRMDVGAAVGSMHGLSVTFENASMQEMELPAGSFDVAVMNNSLCYLVNRDDRKEALGRTLQALRPGGTLVIRNPNRVHHRDQFTGLPFLGLLPPEAARIVAALLRKHRSYVRLHSNRAARRELRRAGFVNVRTVRRRDDSRLRTALTGYQHLIAQRPA